MGTSSVFFRIVCALIVSGVASGEVANQTEKPVKDGRQMYKELTGILLSKVSPVIPANADDVSRPVDITVKMNFVSITDLNMKHQQFKFYAWFETWWYDRSLAWDEAVYPVDRVFLMPDQIWTPTLNVLNSMLRPDQLIKSTLKIAVYSNGLVLWAPGDNLITECTTDIKLYPFDTQTCVIEIGVWNEFEQQVNCSRADISTLNVASPEWDLGGTTIQRGAVPGFTARDRYWFYSYTIRLKRKWLFYALNVLLPVLLVSALNSVVFALPVECGEKMSVSLTTFLTLAVFMTLIQDSLPSNSDTVCYLAVYLGSQMVLSVVAVVMSAVRVACHHRAHLFQTSSTTTFTNSGENQGSNMTTLGEKDAAVAFQKTTADWHQTGLLIDRFCLPIFIVLNILSFAVYCFVVATQ